MVVRAVFVFPAFDWVLQVVAHTNSLADWAVDSLVDTVHTPAVAVVDNGAGTGIAIVVDTGVVEADKVAGDDRAVVADRAVVDYTSSFSFICF